LDILPHGCKNKEAIRQPADSLFRMIDLQQLTLKKQAKTSGQNHHPGYPG